MDQQPQSDDRQTSYVPPGFVPLAPDDRATSFVPVPPPGPAAPSDDRITTLTGTALPAGNTPVYGPGAVVLRGKYRLEERLRGGAQAMAFRATRIVDGAAVFVKIQPNPTGRPDVFAKQIGLRDKLLAIRHPNLLRCHDLDLDGDALCEVYEWLPGRELTRVLAEQTEQFGEDRLRSMVAQLSAAIHELHTATNLSHRDLKPDNISVVERGGREEFVILDYGTVSQLDSGGATTVAGTRVYSPPEFYQRRIPNDPLLSTWDWWSLGRIVQEAIDRIHPYDRLAQLFASDLQSGQHGRSAREAVELIFDTIMLENERSHYGMRAGMVELTESGGRAPGWLPLLRGLLTSRRRSRWGYDQIQRFLRGERVPDSYGAAMDVEGFEFDKQLLTLPELARKLMAESAPETEAGAARWAEAVELVYRGRLGRYVSQTVQDAELARQLQECQRLDDRDLGTALALAAVSEKAVAPAVRGVEINTKFLLSEAAKPEETAAERLQTLLSSSFQNVMKQWHPEHAAELEEEAAKQRGFREVCRKMGVKTDLVGLGAMIRVQHASSEALFAGVLEARKKLNRSDVEPLDKAFKEQDLSRLTPFELRALTLALTQPAKHSFMTHQDWASRLKRSAEKLRNALALQEAAFYLHPVFSAFHGNFKWLAFIVGLVATRWIYSGTASNTVFEAGYRVAPNWLYILGGGLICGLLYASARYLWMSEIRAFAERFMDVKAVDLDAELLQKAAKRLGGDGHYRKQLGELNGQIRTVPFVDHSQYVVTPAKMTAVRRPLAMQIGLLAFLFFGGMLYAPWFVVKEALPTPVAPPAAKQAVKKAPKRPR